MFLPTQKLSKRLIAGKLHETHETAKFYSGVLDRHLGQKGLDVSPEMQRKIAEIPVFLDYLVEKLDLIVFDDEISRDLKKIYTVEVEATSIFRMKILAYDHGDAEIAASELIKKKIEDILERFEPNVVIDANTLDSVADYQDTPDFEA